MGTGKCETFAKMNCETNIFLTENFVLFNYLNIMRSHLSISELCESPKILALGLRFFNGVKVGECPVLLLFCIQGQIYFSKSL